MFATRHTVPTLLGQYNQLASQLGASAYIEGDATLNNKHSVYPNLVPSPGDTSKLQFFGIGIRGSNSAISSIGGDDVPVMVPFMPSEANMDLFHPIPVRMVPTTETLPAEERAKYRMKTTFTAAGGQTFDQYWLKKVEINDVEPIKFETVDGATEARTIYTPDNSNINPSIPTGLETPENIVVSTVLECVLAGWELDHVVTHLLGGRRELACISEYGLYSGADHDFGGGEIESLGVQLAMHRCIRGHDISSPNQQVTETFILEQGNSMIARSFD